MTVIGVDPHKGARLTQPSNLSIKAGNLRQD